ncbi:MAG: alpha/beta fold hydrolase [Deltaproteobacteria bacterium]|nr:alpha/beta fold hydrolase [Deltaproteobacteria bacterium]
MSVGTANKGFSPARWAAGAHAQTVLGAVLPRVVSLPGADVHDVEVEAGTRVRLLCHWAAAGTRAPTVLLLHGLEGSAQSGFMRGMAFHALAAGCNAVRMNMRNCGGTEHLSRTLYHSGLSGDVRAVVEWLAARGHGRLGLAGYSMGGNMVLKLAAEGAPPSVRAVATVCPATDLDAAATQLHRPVNRAYELFFLAGLLRRHARKARRVPDAYPRLVRGLPRSVREFDEVVTAPAFGFAGAADYYARAAAGPRVGEIKVPALVIHAADDPFVPLTHAVRAAMNANPAITLDAPARGGHCGFCEGAASFWAERRVVAFLAERV